VSASRSRNRSFYCKPKNRKLDAATEQQAIASARQLIERSGGLSHEYCRDYWRFSTKAELRGWVETGERFVQGIKNALAKYGEVSISFLPGPGKWNETLAAKLIADAEQGDADADQVLREVAAEYLKADEKPPKPLAYYAATCLWAHSDRKKAQRSLKRCSDEYLARIVYAVSRIFGLAPTRNRATDDRDCACSIVSTAIKKSESTVTKAWDKNKDFGRSSARDIVAEFLELEHDLDQNAVGKNFRAASAPIAVTELPNEENDRRKSQVKIGAAAPR